MALRAPRPDEAGALTDLCLRAKAVWGYDAEMMAAFRAELTVTPEELSSWPSRVDERAGGLAGFVQISLVGDIAELERCFVAPDRQRAGVGRGLFDWASRHARGLGARRMVIVSDPGAAAFYGRMGAVLAGAAPSLSVPGRSLPRLHLAL